MFFAYVLFASAWAYICYKHLAELLPIQVRRLVYRNFDQLITFVLCSTIYQV